MILTAYLAERPSSIQVRGSPRSPLRDWMYRHAEGLTMALHGLQEQPLAFEWSEGDRLHHNEHKPR
jgi:hypothetical protein